MKYYSFVEEEYKYGCRCVAVTSSFAVVIFLLKKCIVSIIMMHKYYLAKKVNISIIMNAWNKIALLIPTGLQCWRHNRRFHNSTLQTSYRLVLYKEIQ